MHIWGIYICMCNIEDGCLCKQTFMSVHRWDVCMNVNRKYGWECKGYVSMYIEIK